VIDSTCSLIPSVEVVRRAFRVSGRGGAFPQSARRLVSLWSTGGLFVTMEERFWSKVKKTDGCWLWESALKIRNPQKAYGHFRWDGKNRPAHRVAWEIANGKPFPDGMFACHHCDNPNCVNPDHIFVGTAKDNARDAVLKGRVRGSKQEGYCIRGHALTPDNLYMSRRGDRVCRICKNSSRRHMRRVHGGGFGPIHDPVTGKFARRTI
jgi:HNH endonuclease